VIGHPGALEAILGSYSSIGVMVSAPVIATVNRPSDFRPLAWVEWSQSLATHLGHRKPLGHYTRQLTKKSIPGSGIVPISRIAERIPIQTTLIKPNRGDRYVQIKSAT
jgi:hypothetical protein